MGMLNNFFDYGFWYMISLFAPLIFIVSFFGSFFMQCIMGKGGKK